MKELFLSTLFASDKLDIVNQENINRAKPISESDHAVEANGIDHLISELFRADVCEPEAWVARLHRMADSLHQVGFPHPDAAVEIERVVGFGGRFGHRPGGCMRELIGSADDKRVEGVSQI